MAKVNWTQYSATPGSNTDIDGVNIDEGCAPSGINNAIREVMAHTADVVAGTVALSTINIDGGAIDGVTLGTNSAVTQAVIDNININGSTIGHTSDTDLLTVASGALTVAGDVTLNAQGDLRFADADSSNYVAFQSPATVASNVTWTLPAADATSSGQVLSSNSSGVLSWADAGGGALEVYAGGGVFEGTTTISRGTWTNIAMTETADSGTTYDGTTFTVPSGEGGVYQLVGYATGSYTSIGNDGEAEYIRFLKGGSTALATNGQLRNTHSERYGAISTSYIGTLSAADTITLQAMFNDGDGSGNAAIFYAGFIAIKVA